MKRNSSKTKPGSNRDGFTLVELVVVIAVLAILAGVGAVAYNGYIEYANKGVDRQTVGEVINAIQLADYADPTLFGTKGAGVVYITDSGIQAVGTGDKLEAGLKDAFGEELSSYSLSYSKWNEKSPDFSIFSNFFDEDGTLTGALSKYQDAIKDGGSASYASEMETLWDIVGTLLPLQQGYSGKDDYLQTLVNYCNQVGGITDTIVNSWTTGVSPNADGSKYNGHQVGAAIAMAQNYAFATYAKTHPSMDAEHLEILNQYTSFDADSAPKAAVSYYATATGIFSDIMTEGGYWYKIAKDYQESQANIDALAFQSLMQAANIASNDLKGEDGKIKDDDFFAAMTQYVDSVGALMVDPDLINVYKELGSTSISGNYIAVSAYKQDGKLTIIVSPNDADPRTNNEVSDSSDSVTYVDNITLSIEEFNKDYTGTVELVLNTTDHRTGTITLPSGAFGSFSYSEAGVAVATSNQTRIIVNASAAGETTITVTQNGRPDLSVPTSFKIHVIVH